MDVLKRVFALSAISVAITVATYAARPLADHIVFIGLDGWAAYTYEDAEMPTVKSMAADGALTLSKRAVLPSSSAVNWASIFMGVPTEVHGYLQWGSKAPELVQPEGVIRRNNILPTIFQVAREQCPYTDMAVFTEWDVNTFLVDSLSLNHCEIVKMPDITDRATDYIRANKPMITAILYDGPDYPGHQKGWGAPEYYAMLNKEDSCISRIVTAVDEAGILDNTVFIITADHGGIDKGHGGTTPQEMLSPLVMWGPGIRKGCIINELVMSYDYPAIMAYILGLEPDPFWRAKIPMSAFETIE